MASGGPSAAPSAESPPVPAPGHRTRWKGIPRRAREASSAVSRRPRTIQWNCRAPAPRKPSQRQKTTPTGRAVAAPPPAFPPDPEGAAAASRACTRAQLSAALWSRDIHRRTGPDPLGGGVSRACHLSASAADLPGDRGEEGEQATSGSKVEGRGGGRGGGRAASGDPRCRHSPTNGGDDSCAGAVASSPAGTGRTRRGSHRDGAARRSGRGASASSPRTVSAASVGGAAPRAMAVSPSPPSRPRKTTRGSGFLAAAAAAAAALARRRSDGRGAATKTTERLTERRRRADDDGYGDGTRRASVRSMLSRGWSAR